MGSPKRVPSPDSPPAGPTGPNTGTTPMTPTSYKRILDESRREYERSQSGQSSSRKRKERMASGRVKTTILYLQLFRPHAACEAFRLPHLREPRLLYTRLGRRTALPEVQGQEQGLRKSSSLGLTVSKLSQAVQPNLSYKSIV